MSAAARRVADWCTLRRVVSALGVLVLAAGWWAFLRPSSLGGPLTLVTVTGVSMQPSFHTGDLAVMRDVDDYDKGDVIAFRTEVVPGQPGATVIHRVVGGDAESGYVTRGDNNDWDDPWRPTAADVTGELWFAVPGFGTWVQWLARPVHLAGLLAGLAAGMTMLGGPAAEAGGKQRVRLGRRKVASA